MKKKSTSQSAFFYLRASAALLLVVAGASLALLGLGQFSAQAQQGLTTATKSGNPNPLVPPMVNCDQMRALHIDKQENLRAGAIAIYCGDAEGGAPAPPPGTSELTQQLLAPLFGAVDQDLVTGTETSPHVTQSETFTAGNPDNPNQIIVAYNDSRGVTANPGNISGASVSTDGGNTYTRLTAASGQSPFPSTYGDPVILYNRPTGTWFTVWLDAQCGDQGLGGFKSTTPSDPSPTSWTHYCVHNGSSDDRESGWTDSNPNSQYYGRMYVSFNDFNRGGGALFVRYSTDNGLTWTNERQLTNSFFRDVQITGDSATGAVYVASMDEMSGGLTSRANKIFRSTDGGNTWTNTYTGPTFSAPGRSASGFFATMYNDPAYWRHQGWGEPAALNGVVHYVYDARNTATGDPADVFYIRSTDGGVTFSAPFELNTNSDPSKAQFQPNLSVAADGTLFAVWYDERENAGPCQPSSPSKPCYRMWSRESFDNGVTWSADEPYSDVVSPLPLQPDSSIVSIYAGDYDYGSSLPSQHIHAWVDGRKAINGNSQQDAFVDREPASSGPNLVSAVSRLTHGNGAGTFDVNMPLSGPSGVEDRQASTYYIVLTFNVAVTSGTATVTSGTGTAGAPTFSGSTATVPLTGITDSDAVTVTLNSINGSSATASINLGFLVGDYNADRFTNGGDTVGVRGLSGATVDGTDFRADVNLDGFINGGDATVVQGKSGNSIP